MIQYLLSMRGSAGQINSKDWMDDDLSIGLGKLPDRTPDALPSAAGFPTAREWAISNRV